MRGVDGMTASRKDRFDKALRRLAQTDPKELKDAFAEAQRESDEVKRYVEERKESIRKGASRAAKRFRL
jgi:hypothetical protein